MFFVYQIFAYLGLDFERRYFIRMEFTGEPTFRLDVSDAYTSQNKVHFFTLGFNF